MGSPYKLLAQKMTSVFVLGKKRTDILRVVGGGRGGGAHYLQEIIQSKLVFGKQQGLDNSYDGAKSEFIFNEQVYYFFL